MQYLDAIDPARLARRLIRQMPSEVMICIAAVLTFIGLILLVQGATMRAQARNAYRTPWWGQPVVPGQEVWDRRGLIFMAIGGGVVGAGLLSGSTFAVCVE
jgi:hypothetical protein